ncbi:MAG: hypothetical protein DMG65_09070 [Candidatus Angelobacter sp. Gp1-AA117]|nr:MAG: hypothetical protein DMG65_09070 [Candidatus Angelobacter sp. Gp1-AA117]
MKFSRRLTAFLLIAILVVWADNKPVPMPAATHAKTYPAHEAHDDEKVSIAVDPFDMPDKAKVFKVNYQQKGLLPVRVIISNDADGYLMLNDLKIEFITVQRDKLEPLTSDDIYRKLMKADSRPDQRGGVKLPLPLPKRDKSPVSKETRESITETQDAQLLLTPVDGHSLRSGFLFFDVTGLSTPEAGAHILFTGLKVGGKELFYFDIPLEKYLSYQPGK